MTRENKSDGIHFGKRFLKYNTIPKEKIAVFMKLIENQLQFKHFRYPGKKIGF